jgi:acetyl esterase
MLEPVTQQFVDQMAGAAAVHTLPVEAARAFLSGLQSMPVGQPGVQADDLVLPIGKTGSVPVRIVRPFGAARALPAILYFHGGGWVLGDRTTHDRLIREITVGVGAAVVFVEYSRAPEAGFPVAIEQGFAAARYVAENASTLNIDPFRLAVAGDGAGGNIAAAVTLLAKERRGPKIGYQVLFYPVMGADFDTRSYLTFAEGAWLTKSAMQWFWDAYLPDPDARKQITATPLNATPDQVSGLPEALIIVAENDVLRDEGEAYAQLLMEAGVRVTAARYYGTIHDFVMLNALADTPAARGAIAQAICALKSVFG